jgi:hypothetical protein
MQVRVSKWMASDNEPYYIAQVPKGIGHLTPKRVLSRLLAQSKGLGLPDMSDPDRIVLMEGEPDDRLLFGDPDLRIDARRISRVHFARVRPLDFLLH